ncbi:MAG TPA: hypothetical protein VGR10_06515, partial [Thermoleophilaceae bacterium]|nr:hypothetical protein [Thermoleophilaceae bacterium]
FRAAIAAGVPGILVGPGRYAVDDFIVPASTSEAVLTGLLRDELGFDAGGGAAPSPPSTPTRTPRRSAAAAPPAARSLARRS